MINPYQGPSLQDILGQDYSSGYAPQPQLGVGDMAQAVPPSAYSTMTGQNPGFADQIQAAIARQLGIVNDPRSQQPSDMAYGRESSFGRTNQGVPDDETSALDVAQSIIKLPFGLLSEGRNLIQDTLGLPGAQARRRDADQLQALQNLPQAQRQLLGIDQISGISTPGASVGDSSGTAGAPSSLGQNAGSTMKGFVQWTQNLGRDRAQQTMDQVRMAIKAQYAAGKIGLQEAQRLTELATGNANVEQSRFLQSRTRGQDIQNFFMPAQEQADLRVKGTAATANLAQAGASNANARNADARTRTEDALRDPAVSEAKAKASNAWNEGMIANDTYYSITRPKGIAEMEREDDKYRSITRPAGLEAVTQLYQKGANDARGFSIWRDNEAADQRRRDALAAAEGYERTARGDAAIAGTADDVARAESIRNTDPLRMRALEAGITRTGAQTEFLNAQTGVANARRTLTDEQAKAIPSRLAGELAKLDVQMEGMQGQQRLRDMQTRLYEVMADTRLNRDQREAALDNMDLELGNLREEVLRSSMENADSATQMKAKLIDGQLERIQSDVLLNNARSTRLGLLPTTRTGGRGQAPVTGTALLQTDFDTRKEYDRRVAAGQDPVRVAQDLGIPLKTNEGFLWNSQEANFAALPDAIRERAEKLVPSAPPVQFNPQGPRTAPSGATMDPTQRRKPVSIDEWDNEVPKLPTASAARDWIMEHYGLDAPQATSIAKSLSVARSGRR